MNLMKTLLVNISDLALEQKTILLLSKQFSVKLDSIPWECGEIGRHDGLKIRCFKRRGGSSPPVPITIKHFNQILKVDDPIDQVNSK